MAAAYVYILTNDRRTVLYTGATNDLRARVRHHKHRLVLGFTRRHNVHRLVYFERLSDMDAARTRELYCERVISALLGAGIFCQGEVRRRVILSVWRGDAMKPW